MCLLVSANFLIMSAWLVVNTWCPTRLWCFGNSMNWYVTYRCFLFLSWIYSGSKRFRVFDARNESPFFRTQHYLAHFFTLFFLVSLFFWQCFPFILLLGISFGTLAHFVFTAFILILLAVMFTFCEPSAPRLISSFSIVEERWHLSRFFNHHRFLWAGPYY